MAYELETYADSNEPAVYGFFARYFDGVKYQSSLFSVEEDAKQWLLENSVQDNDEIVPLYRIVKNNTPAENT
jgi:hypothetical protein